MIAFLPAVPGAALPRALRAALANEPRFAAAAAMLALAIVPTIIAHALDDRMIGGVPAWSKPLKFEAALAVYLGTLAWFAAWMPRRLAESRGYRAFSIVVLAAVALEMVWLVGAAAHGVPAHFNVATPLMARIYSLMGALAVTLTAASLLLGVAILRARDAGGDPVLRLAIGLGLAMTFVLTVPVAGYMSGANGHLVAVDAQSVQRLALLGWARNGGDLRVAHFLATHAMHAVPLAGWLAARLLRPPQAYIAVILCAAAYGMLVAWTFLQALSGHPFLPGLG